MRPVLVWLFLCIAPSFAWAGFTHTLTTNAQATIADGSHSTQGGVPRDGTPDAFAPNRPAPVLNAFLGTFEYRGVSEFDVSTLVGINITSARLRFVGGYSPSGYFADQNLVSGYTGNGAVTISDFSRTDTALGYLPGVTVLNQNPQPASITNPEVDVTDFLRSLTGGGGSYAGFVLSQRRTTNGVTFEQGAVLVVTADTDFAVPNPLPTPPGVTPPSVQAVPVPTGATLFGTGAATGLLIRLVRRRPRMPTA